MSMSVFPSVSERKQIKLLPTLFCPKTSIRLRWLLNDSIIIVSSSDSGSQEGVILYPMGNLVMFEDILIVTGGCYWNLVY